MSKIIPIKVRRVPEGTLPIGADDKVLALQGDEFVYLPPSAFKGENAPHVKYQYSANGTTWSDTVGANAIYFRTSVNGGETWSAAVKFREEDGTYVEIAHKTDPNAHQDIRNAIDNSLVEANAHTDSKIATIQDRLVKDLGSFPTADALRAAHPTASAGYMAYVASTDTVWIWSEALNKWVDSDKKGEVTDAQFREHVDDSSKHLQEGERAKWNEMLNAGLTAEAGTGTDKTTPAVAQTTVPQLLQAIWSKIRQVANSIPTVPTSLKNPNALTIQQNGTTKATYDGSTAQIVNIETGGSTTPTTETGTFESDLYWLEDWANPIKVGTTANGKWRKMGNFVQITFELGTRNFSGITFQYTDTNAVLGFFHKFRVNLPFVYPGQAPLPLPAIYDELEIAPITFNHSHVRGNEAQLLYYLTDYPDRSLATFEISFFIQ